MLLPNIRTCTTNAIPAASLFLLLVAIGFGPEAAAQAPVPALQGQHLLRPQSVQQREFEVFLSALAKEEIARLQVTPAPHRTDGARWLIDSVRSGKVDLAVVPLAAFGEIAPRFRIFEIPFLFKEPWHFRMVQLDSREQLKMLEDLRAKGLEGIGWLSGEPLVIASRKPILEPTDLRDLRTATYSALDIGEASAVELFKNKLGAVPIQTPRNRAMADLRSGKIDVLEIELTELGRLRPQQLSVLLTNHLYNGYVVIANPARWAALPSNMKDSFVRQLQRANDRIHEELADAVDSARRELKQAKGVSLISIPQNQRTPWREALRSESLSAKAGDNFVKHVETRLYGQSANGKMMSGRGREVSITWNAWFESGPETAPKDVPVLELNNVYRFNLDLARYRYSETLSADLGTSLEKLLDGQGERVLLLHPVLLGDQLKVAPGKSLKPRELTVKLERARAGPGDVSFLERFEKHKITTRALSGEVNLGGFVSWDLKAAGVGCGGIAVTVWDQARSVPLDHIVLKVPVHQKGKGPESCGWNGTGKTMTAGLRSMLEGPVPEADTRTPDAALHIFETQEGNNLESHAVLLHRKRLLASLADPNATDSGVYSWQLASALSSYVSKPEQMPQLIQEAHQAILTGSGKKYPYEDVAKELALKIFSGNSDYDREQAEKGRAALRDVIDGTAEPAVVVRVVSEYGETYFVPFGLIAARAEQPVVSKRFTVIQPLPASRRLSSDCIGPWNVARPKILQGVSGDARKLLATAASTPLPKDFQILPDHASLTGFLNSSGTATQGHGEGLILLAHHNQGYLRFSDTDRPPSRIGHDYITRDFRPGSVAMLAACTTVGNVDETSAIVNRLVSQGVDTLIVSPFAVDAEFGTRFALEFEKLVIAERASASGASMRTLFDRAANAVMAAYENQDLRRDMALEFMLVGNPDVKLCK
jgi:TRAP-type C4-dicarboxylate transport system substrate-binding protein